MVKARKEDKGVLEGGHLSLDVFLHVLIVDVVELFNGHFGPDVDTLKYLPEVALADGLHYLQFRELNVPSVIRHSRMRKKKQRWGPLDFPSYLCLIFKKNRKSMVMCRRRVREKNILKKKNHGSSEGRKRNNKSQNNT